MKARGHGALAQCLVSQPYPQIALHHAVDLDLSNAV